MKYFSFLLSVCFVYKQHPVKHAKGRAKLDGVIVAEVTSDTLRKVSCSRLSTVIQNTKVTNKACVKVLYCLIIQNAKWRKSITMPRENHCLAN